MKKTSNVVGIVALMMMIVTSSQAQLSLGVKAGVNRSTFRITSVAQEPGFEFDYLTGINLGVVLNYELNDYLSLNSGATFVRRGANLDLTSFYDESLNVEGQSFYRMNYIEIPIHLSFSRHNLRIYGGPYLGIGLKSKQISDYSFNIVDSNNEFVYSGILNPIFGKATAEDFDFEGDESPFSVFDIGLNLGIGYVVGPILISIDYSYGFRDIFPLEEGQSEDNVQLTNSGINLSGTYMF